MVKPLFHSRLVITQPEDLHQVALAYLLADVNGANVGPWLKWLDVGGIVASTPYDTYETSIMELNFVNDLMDMLLLAKNIQRLVLPRADMEYECEYRPRCAGAIAAVGHLNVRSLRKLSMLAEVTPRGEISILHIGRFTQIRDLELAFWGDVAKCDWLKGVPAWTMPHLRRLHWKGPGIGLSFLQRCYFEALEYLSLEVCELYDDVVHLVELVSKHPHVKTLSLDGMDYPSPDIFMPHVKAPTFMIVPTLFSSGAISMLSSSTHALHFIIKCMDKDVAALRPLLRQLTKVKTSVKDVHIRLRWGELESSKSDPFGVHNYAPKLSKMGITLHN